MNVTISEDLMDYIRENNPGLSEDEVEELARQTMGGPPPSSAGPPPGVVGDEEDTDEGEHEQLSLSVDGETDTDTDSENGENGQTQGAEAFMSERQDVWSNSIVDFDPVMPITQLVANDMNWRRHPDLQNEAMRAALKAVGIIQSVIWNRTTGKLVDGHLRLALAIEEGYDTWPTTIIELTEEQEKIALASYDPLSAMAVADAAKFQELMDDIGHVDVDTALKDMFETERGKLGLLDEDEKTLDDLNDEYDLDEDDEAVTYWPNFTVKQVNPDVALRAEFFLKAAPGNTDGEKFASLIGVLEKDETLASRATKLQQTLESEE